MGSTLVIYQRYLYSQGEKKGYRNILYEGGRSGFWSSSFIETETIRLKEKR